MGILLSEFSGLRKRGPLSRLGGGTLRRRHGQRFGGTGGRGWFRDFVGTLFGFGREAVSRARLLAGRGQSWRRADVGNVGSTVWLLLGAVGLVLLIACVNVASLLLARAISRERELAMRVALGAGRGRLARQCLTESVVLALSGCALGILLAAIGIRPFVALWPGSLPRAVEVQLVWRVLPFSLALSLAAGLFLRLAPALRAPARELEQALRAGARTIA